MTKIARAAAAALLCLGAAACGGEDAYTDGGSAEVDQSATQQTPGGGETAAPGVQNIPRPEQTIAAGRLSPVNNSGVTGSVNFRAVGEQTEILLNVTGASQGNQQLQGAIVAGTCDQPGAQVAPVGPLTMGTGNIVTLADTLPLPVATVLSGENALLIKGQNAGPATPALACAPLPKWERLPPVG